MIFIYQNFDDFDNFKSCHGWGYWFGVWAPGMSIIVSGSQEPSPLIIINIHFTTKPAIQLIPKQSSNLLLLNKLLLLIFILTFIKFWIKLCWIFVLIFAEFSAGIADNAFELGGHYKFEEAGEANN